MPVRMNAWIRVGKIKDAHGLKGELFVLLFAKEAPWLEDLESFALGTADEGPFDLYEVERAKPHSDGLIVKVRTISDRTAAEAKKGLLFYLPASFLVSRQGERIYLREILGFEVRTALRSLGPILDFSSNGAQDLLVVKVEGKSVEIPFVQDFIEKIDFESRCVWMQLPEGLWESE